MERSGNFYKAIRLGYILISILIGCMAYNSLYEWQEIEALELGNKKIDELRKEINNINIQMIKFSLLGETILEWNDKDIEHYHARRMAMDSMLCRFKATYPAERIDSVRSLLEDKERQMFQIVRLMDEQQSINKKIANQIPVIVQKSVQEQSKKPKRKGFLGIFGKKKEVTPAVSTTIPSNPQSIGFSGILLAKRQNSFYCTYFLHNRNVADTKSPYPIKRLEVIRRFNQKDMAFNQSLS